MEVSPYAGKPGADYLRNIIEEAQTIVGDALSKEKKRWDAYLRLSPWPCHVS